MAAESAQKLPEFLEKLPKDSPLGTAIGICAAVAMVLGFVATQTETLQKIIEGWQKILAAVRGTQHQQPGNSRKKLLRAIKGEVTRRRIDSLHNLVMVDLLIQEQHQQVGRSQLLQLVPEPESQVERVLKVKNHSENVLGETRTLFNIFNRADIDGKLLILGEPGSGKTTEILKFAEDFIHRAESNQANPVPVIFELSTWKDDRSIDQWLIAQLKENYNVSPSVARQWLQDEQLLPLLDGLDELGIVRQTKCIQAINEFLLESAYPHFVVCCRREEYEAGKVKLNELNGAIYLQPLTDFQIQAYLENVKRPRLWENIQQQPELKELAQIPLLLTIMIVAHQGRAIRDRQELFDAYLEQRFTQPLIRQAYASGKEPDRRKTQQYLSWLANKLKEESKTEFLIEKMQPTLLRNPSQKRQYWLIFGVCFFTILAPLTESYNLLMGLTIVAFGFVFGLVGRPIFILLSKLESELIASVIFGSIFGAILGMMSTWTSDPSSGVTRGVIGGLILTVIFSRIEKIEPIEALNFSKIAWQEVLEGVAIGLAFGLLVGVVFRFWLGLFFGLTFGLGLGLILGLKAEIKTRTFPNQGIWSSAKNVFVLTLVLCPVLTSAYLLRNLYFGFSSGLIAELADGLLTGLASGMIIGVVSSGRACIQHFALRLILWQSGMIPWDCARFLEYASDLRFVQRVGGRYRFIHALLKEHFAAMENQ